MNGSIKIDGQEFALGDLSESELLAHVNRRRSDGVRVCVLVKLETHCGDVWLGSGHCQKYPGSPPTHVCHVHWSGEWARLGLNAPDFDANALHTFVKTAATANN